MAALRSFKLASLFSAVVSQPVGGGVGMELGPVSARSFRPYLSIRLGFGAAFDEEAGLEGRLVGPDAAGVGGACVGYNVKYTCGGGGRKPCSRILWQVISTEPDFRRS